MRRMLLALPALLLLSLYGPPARAKIIYFNPAAPGPVHDGTSWATAYTTIPNTSELALSGDEVWFAAGTYQQVRDINTFGGGFVYLRKGAGYYGGFNGTETARSQRNPRANVTILRGDGTGAVVYVDRDCDRTGVVDGFTITGGGGQNDWTHVWAGGGVFVDYGGSATISNNMIADNSTNHARTYTDPRLNIYPGPGGGVYINSGSPAFIGNTIIRNTCGTDGSGVFVAGGSPLFASNIIAGNLNGSGVRVTDGAPSFINNSIVNHSVKTGLALGGTGSIVRGNIIAYNQIGVVGTAAVFAGNDVYGNGSDYGSTDQTGVNGNIRQDPQFVSWGTLDLRLKPGSPCIDAGDDTVLPFLMPDALGQPRVMGAAVDMGAVETPGEPKLWPVFTVQPTATQENAAIAPPPAVHVVHQDGSPATEFNGLVTLGILPGSGRPGAALSGNLTVQATAGTASFPGISINKRGDGYMLAASGPQLVRGSSQAFPVTVPPGGSRIIRVMGSAPGPAHDGLTWATAFTTLQEGLAATYDGDEIWVAAGTYTASGTQPVATLGDGVALYGGFAGNESSRDQRDWRRCETILDGGQRKVPVVSVAKGSTSSTVLDGFTIRNGSLHGIFCDGASDVIIRNNRITGNRTVTINDPTGNGSPPVDGAGIYILNGAPTIARNAFIGNTAGGYGYGGAIHTEGSARITDNLFLRNKSGIQAMALNILGTGNAIVANNTFVSNGNAYWQSTVQFASSGDGLFANNVMAFGSSIHAWNTVAIRNNDMWLNARDYSEYMTDQTGVNGNIKADPKFRDYTGDDFRICSNSGCRNTGDSTVVGASEFDLDGNPRLNGQVDIGAYEFTPLQYTFSLGAPTRAPLAVADGALYIGADDGRIYGLATGSNRALSGFPVDVSGAVGAAVKMPGRAAAYYGRTGKAIYASSDRGDVVRVLPNGTVAWTVRPLGGPTLSTPAVTADGRVLVNLGWDAGATGVLNFLLQLDEATGLSQYISPYLGASAVNAMRDRSPAVDSHYIYLNAGTDTRGGLVVLNQYNLTVQADLAMGEDALPPYISGASVFVVTRGGRLHKANSATCSPDLAFATRGAAEIGEPVRAAPFVYGGSVYVGTARGRVYAFDETRGTRSLVYDTGKNEAIGGLTITRASGGVLAFGDAGGGAYVVPLSNRSAAMRHSMHGPVTTPPVYDPVTGLYCFMAETGMLFETTAP